jgi:hypothetical protein
MGSTVSMVMAAIELLVIIMVIAWRQRLNRSASISGGKG